MADGWLTRKGRVKLAKILAEISTGQYFAMVPISNYSLLIRLQGRTNGRHYVLSFQITPYY
jgi:hypothetical protein